VEAVELQGHKFGIGVQWHPEEGDDTRIFEALVAAAKPATAPAPAAEVTGRSKRNSKRHATRSLRQRWPHPGSGSFFSPAQASAYWTGGAARARLALPAAAEQNRGDLLGGPAPVRGGVGPAVPQRFRSLDQV
jgi:hypothetical protein